MREIWHSISYQGTSPPGGAVWAEAHIDVSSPWFSGHFPGDPILPGIALLAMVRDIIRRHETEKGRRLRIMGIEKVRFRLPIRPGESLSISLSLPEGDGPYACRFKVAASGGTACTGLMDVEWLAPEP